MADRFPLIANTTSSQIQELASGDNLDLSGSNISNCGTIKTLGLLNANGNGVGNIGNASTYFNTVFAQSTSAVYADLAEMYTADVKYLPGTVVVFGGEQEITVTTTTHDSAVAGVVSTNPSYLMNATLSGDYPTAIALVGRVPCQVIGPIKKGDRLVSSSIPGVAQRFDLNLYQPGSIIGKALEDYDSDQVGTIEIAVGRD